jgi:hypothetical protein
MKTPFGAMDFGSDFAVFVFFKPESTIGITEILNVYSWVCV